MSPNRIVITAFLVAGGQQEWIDYGPMKVYVRRGVHMIDRVRTDTFDIANVNIEHENLRGKGTFTEFVSEVEAVFRANPELLKCRFGHETKGIYVENVYSNRLAAKLEKMGFQPVSTVDGIHVPSFYSPLPMPFGKLARD